MDSAAKMKALSLKLVLLLVVARSSICNGQTPASVPGGAKTLSTDNATDFSCLNRTFDMYFPNIETGCQKFHLCTKTEGNEVLNLSFMCPEGTSFDFRSADCQSAETVTCKPENGGTRAVRKVSKQLKNKLQLAQPKTSFKCRGKKLGSYYADVETNCTTFHLCTMGEFKSEILDFQFMCLEGTLFDEQWLQCRPEGLTTCGKQQPTTVPPVETLTESPKPLSSAVPPQEPTLAELPVLQQPIASVQEPLLPTLPEPSPPTTTVGPDYLSDFNASDADYDYYGDEQAIPIREKRSVTPVAIKRIMSVNSEHIRVKRVPPPNFTMDTIPSTTFSCADKIPGGYYADIETGCQLYHVCAPGADGAMRSTKFLCGNNTVFSQQTRTCQIWYTVDCESTPQFFALNEELSRVQPEVTLGGSDNLQQQQRTIDQSSALSDVLPSRRPVDQTVPRHQPRPVVQQTASVFDQGFDTFIDQQPIREPVFQQQQPAVAVDQQPDFAGRFQDLADAQRSQDSARPPRRRKQKRRRKQRPRPQPQPQPEIADPFPQDVFGLGIPAPQSPFVESVPQRHAPARVPVFSSDNQPQQHITEPQVFNIPDHVPGLLEEIQVRGRFQQTEDDLIREAEEQIQPRRNPQRVRLQQQESIEVRVPTAQRVTPAPIQETPQPADSLFAQPASPPSDFSTQPGGSVFAGFDAFIQDAIQQEHEQRARLGPILEQRRREEEAERERERQAQRQRERQQEQQRPATRKRKKPKTTTPRPVTSTQAQEPQQDFSPRPNFSPRPDFNIQQDFTPQQEFQPSFVLSGQRQPQQPVARFPDFPTRSQQQQQVVRRDPLPVQIQNQVPIALIQTGGLPRPVVNQPSPSLVPQRQNIQPAQAPQPPASNFNGFVFQQFQQQRPQQPIINGGLGEFLVLVPSESEIIPSGFIRPDQQAAVSRPALAPVAQGQSNFPPFTPQAQAPTAQSHGDFLHFTSQTNAPTAQRQSDFPHFTPQTQAPPAQGPNDFLSFTPQAPAPQPTQGQTQLLRFESANSSGFEIRTRFRRQVPLEFLKDKTTKDEVYPATPFSCKGKVLGGYYADTYTSCNMFHICTSGRKKGLLYDFRFWCANGTVFDQRSQTCSAPEKVKCDLSAKYYPTHPLPAEQDVPVPNPELLKVRIKRAVKNVLAVGPNDSRPTAFRCAGRDPNKYYADAETNCQMFHLCAENGPGGRLADYPFICRNGTVFDQRAQACDDQTDALNCQDDPPHYGIGEDFGRF